MNWQRWALFAERQFLASLVLLHVVATAWLQVPLWRPNAVWADMLADTLPFSQSILLLGWAILGPGRWYVRVLCVPLLVLLYNIWTLHWGVAESDHILRLLVATLAVTLPIAAIARMRKLCISLEPSSRPGAKLQFSLRWLIGMMSLSAVLVWLAQIVREQVNPGVAVPSLLACTLVALAFGAVSAICTWAMLRAAHPGVGIFVALTTAPLLGILVTLLVRRLGDAMVSAGWLEVHAVLLVLSLAPLRIIGYRLAPLGELQPAASGDPASTQQKYVAVEDAGLTWPVSQSRSPALQGRAWTICE